MWKIKPTTDIFLWVSFILWVSWKWWLLPSMNKPNTNKIANDGSRICYSVQNSHKMKHCEKIMNRLLPSSLLYSLHKKWSFPLKISSANMTKFGHIYWRNPYWKTSFFVQLFSQQSVMQIGTWNLLMQPTQEYYLKYCSKIIINVWVSKLAATA